MSASRFLARADLTLYSMLRFSFHLSRQPAVMGSMLTTCLMQMRNTMAINAVMVSLAYVKKDVREILELAIDKYLPHDSEYYSVVKFALDRCKEYGSWKQAWEKAREKYKKYNWVHAYPNAASEVISLWYGNGDFDYTMNISSMIGYDVDCNAAQIATVLGIIGKERTVSERWTAPIGDKLKTYLRQYKEISIKKLAEYTVDISKKM